MESYNREGVIKMKVLEINGVKIEDNLCSCLNARVSVKYFDYFLKPTFPKDDCDNNISLTHIKIMELVNNAESVKIFNMEGKTYLHIDNELYKVVVDIPKEGD
jgi:hypothetical protein